MNPNIEPWIAAEFEYAKRLRNASASHRPALYVEAYNTVAGLRWGTSDDLTDPERRTAGTNRHLAESIRALCSPQDDVIEFGAGRGFTAMIVAPFVRSYVATDISEASLDETRRLIGARCPEANCRVAKCSGIDIARQFQPGSFSAAVSIDVIEHLHPEDAREHYRQVVQILRPGGHYIIATPNRLSGPHDITRLVYPDAKEPLGFHLNETSHSELNRELRLAGFSRVSTFLLQDQNGLVELAAIWKKLLAEIALNASSVAPGIHRRLRSKVHTPINLVATK